MDVPPHAALIQVDGLTQDYPGHRALDGVGFAVPAGSITALVGPNGAGKTTLMRCLAALDPPFAGRVRVAGLEVSEAPRAVHRVTGFLQDIFGLYDGLTVEQGLWHAAAARAVPTRDIPERIAWAADAVGLADRFKQKAGSLSRGLRQRLAIAQTMVHRPRVLLLDEPASGLDPESRADLAALFRRLSRDLGTTLVVSSHILAELEDYSTHMLILREGRVVRHAALDASTGTPSRTAAVRLVLRLAAPCPDLATMLEGMSEVRDVDVWADGETVRLSLEDGHDPARRAALLRALVARDVAVCGFDLDRRNLQDVYLDHVRPAATARPTPGKGHP
nr:ABC transporter ATP-binding protein [Roseospira visakhapatnamensis]